MENNNKQNHVNVCTTGGGLTTAVITTYGEGDGEIFQQYIPPDFYDYEPEY